MDSDEDWGDDSFLNAVDQLVAQHQTRQTQQPPLHQRGTQPASPPPLALAPAAPLQQQPAGPLQQLNGPGSGGATAAPGQAHKPPLPAQRQHPPPQQQPQHPPPLQGRPPQGQGGLPLGHVSQAAAQLQAAAAQPQWQGAAGPGGMPRPGSGGGDVHSRLAQLQAELSRSESQNKLLHSNLQQRERELGAMRQKAAQLERERGGAAGGSGGAAGMQQRSGFAATELQRQLDQMRSQLLFKEDELTDLKRQHAERTERLKAAEASVAELKSQLRQQPAGQAQAQPAQAPAADASSHQPRNGSASGQKRRQSGSGAAAAAGAADVVTPPGAAPPPPAGSAPEAAAAAAAGAGPAAGAAGPKPLLLDPAVLAAASSLGGSSTNLVAQLMAACSASVSLLIGAPSWDGAATAAPAAAPTALLLRSRLAAAEQAPDAISQRFVAAFSQRLHQVSCGILPAAALLDSIGCLLAESLAEHNAAAGAAAAAAGAAGGGPGGSLAGLPTQRVQLLTAGLQVAQHLIDRDAGCAAAALGSSTSIGGSTSALGAPPRLSSRVTLLSSSGAAVPPPLAGAAQLLGSAPGLPATEALSQQHAPLFAGLACGSSCFLPLLLAAALWLGDGEGKREKKQHEAVAAAALGALLAAARALHGKASRSMLSPVFTSGAMELFMKPWGLRLPALHLLRLLLEEPALAQLFESSLSLAAAARGEPGPPTATAGTSGMGDGTGTPGNEVGGPGGNGNGRAAGGGGAQPMQVDGPGAAGDPGSWIGAAAITERLLDSFMLDSSAQPAAGQSGSSSGSAAASSGPQAGAAAAGAGGDASSSSGGSSNGGTAVARAAMQLVAGLREARQQGILVCLLLDDACGAPGCMLAQRLLQLAEAATAMPGDEGGMLMLCPLPWPEAEGGAAGGSAGSGSNSGNGSASLLQQQAAWWQRLRVAQEALTLLRGLLVDDSCSVAAMDDLVSIPAAARLTLTTLSRLARLEGPAAPASDGDASGSAAAAVAVALPPPLLAPWARAIGSSTDQPSIAEAMAGGANGSAAAGALPRGPPACSVEDVVYMARSARRRVLVRMQGAAMQR